MMNAGLRTLVRRTLVVLAVVAALGAGSLVHSSLGSPSSARVAGPSVTTKLDPSDLLLAASTATGIHMRFTGIPTGPASSDHTNEIPISSFQFGVGRSVSGASGAPREAGAANVSEVTVTHATDTFSIALLKASMNGVGSATATLFFTNLTGEEARRRNASSRVVGSSTASDRSSQSTTSVMSASMVGRTHDPGAPADT